MRITDDDLAYWRNEINRMLAHTKSRIRVRRHYYNGLTCIVETNQDFDDLREPMFCGTKREVYNYLRAMVAMHRMLTES